MSETKADLEQQLADAQKTIERLQGELISARTAAESPARVTFPARPVFRGGTQLSEGDRQALETQGVINDVATGGRLYADDFGIEVRTESGREALRAARSAPSPAAAADGIEGLTHIYPSIRPGVLAPDAPVRGAVVDTAVPDVQQSDK